MYRIGDKIGNGAFGVIYVCQHKITKKQAVMKCGEKMKFCMKLKF